MTTSSQTLMRGELVGISTPGGRRFHAGGEDDHGFEVWAHRSDDLSRR
jgi:hypothetical protein